MFINPDPNCEPLSDFIGDLDARMTHLPMERRHKAVHVAKRLLCNWAGGRLIEGMDQLPSSVMTVDWAEKRATAAAARRESLRSAPGDLMDEVSDAELLDPIYYSLFPNISHWGSFNQIFYRFRRYGDDPEQCIHECLFMWLALDDDYVGAPQLGHLAKVFNQGTLNLPYLQKGLHSSKEVIIANYGESKPRHCYMLHNQWLGIP